MPLPTDDQIEQMLAKGMTEEEILAKFSAAPVPAAPAGTFAAPRPGWGARTLDKALEAVGIPSAGQGTLESLIALAGLGLGAKGIMGARKAVPALFARKQLTTGATQLPGEALESKVTAVRDFWGAPRQLGSRPEPRLLESGRAAPELRFAQESPIPLGESPLGTPLGAPTAPLSTPPWARRVPLKEGRLTEPDLPHRGVTDLLYNPETFFYERTPAQIQRAIHQGLLKQMGLKTTKVKK